MSDFKATPPSLDGPMGSITSLIATEFATERSQPPSASNIVFVVRQALAAAYALGQNDAWVNASRDRYMEKSLQESINPPKEGTDDGH